MTDIKEPVRLREKPLKSGGASLYLDIYYKGKRYYEFLKLYTVKPTDKEARERNKKTISIANQVKAQRIIEVESGAYKVKLEQSPDTPFFGYFDKICEDKEMKGGRMRTWKAVRRIILEFSKDEDLTFMEIDRQFCEGLRRHIDKSENKNHTQRVPLEHGTKQAYWTIFKYVLHLSVRDEIMAASPADAVDGFKPSEARRVYLTVDEIATLSQTECRHDIIKRAFLFSCLTGLRSCDVKRLKWENVTEENGYTRITFRQQKTQQQEYLDINRQATALMGDRGKKSDVVFPIVFGHDRVNIILRDWVRKAGIDKHVTFHVARHTFATMLLTNGVDLYTVSKLVGHKDIKTTQIYAKIVDEKKRSAVDSIPDILG